jgi:hypothetical protein
MGVTWRVREVRAVYAAQKLRDGFSIEYADFSGTDWTAIVSAEDANEKLLLRFAEEAKRP